MFDGFELTRCEGDGATLRVRHGGSGPAVLLLHGHPRTHATWHRVAPPLAAAGSPSSAPTCAATAGPTSPPTDPEHRPYSKRAMAGDCLAVMRRLGHERFAVVGHDRGAYVAIRLALDHPEAVSAAQRAGRRPHRGGPAPRATPASRRAGGTGSSSARREAAERVINADPDAWYRATAAHDGRRGVRGLPARRSTTRPPCTPCARTTGPGSVSTGTHDDADRAAGRRIGCPLQILWATRDDMTDLYGDVLGVWRDWADDRRGGPIDSGHHMAEEAPEALVGTLRAFWERAGHTPHLPR